VGVSFTEAAGRHATDARLLDAAHRIGNANHLWGFAAECALKAVLRAVDGPTLFTSAGMPKPPYKEHIDRLWPEVLTFLSGRSEAYLTAVLPATNPFDRWSVHGRYGADADAPDTITHDVHRRGAELCMLVLELARSWGHRE
jgi:hypothetical protein